MIDRRSLIRNSSAAGFGALALTAVSSGTELAYGSTGHDGHPTGYPEGLSRGVRRHLEIFDELDFDVFTHQKWDRLGESHARTIRVHWPDGHYTDGIDRHIEDLKALFVWAPDTRIESHYLRVAGGGLTAVAGVMKGTFTRPMPDGKGGFIAPTGRKYAVNMATIGLWNRGRTMDEEFPRTHPHPGQIP